MDSDSSSDQDDEHDVLTSIKSKYKTKCKEKYISQFNTSALKTHAGQYIKNQVNDELVEIAMSQNFPNN
jgi:hypothetical protein